MSKCDSGQRVLRDGVLAVLFMLASAAAYAIDPTLTVGSDGCIDCHGPEHDIWGETTHFKTYDELSSSDAAIDIADALGIDDIEAPDGLCVGCHFTLVGETLEDAEPISGISCESCHGPAANWIDGHGEYLSGDAASESPEEKATRIKAAADAGQIRPAQINLIAANCLECHTVPNEELVNTGGHPAGSAFELVSWSQGEVRHNLFWSDGEVNEEASPERKRVLFVVGHATDLEYSLRALHHSQSEGKYRDEMAARVENAIAQLSAIDGKINSADVKAMLAAADGLTLSGALDSAAIASAADKIQTAAQSFTKGNDGGSLAALDSLIPTGEGHYSEKY